MKLIARRLHQTLHMILTEVSKPLGLLVFARAADRQLALPLLESLSLLQLIQGRLDRRFDDTGKRELGTPVDDGSQPFHHIGSERQRDSLLPLCDLLSMFHRILSFVT
jgi:hypothetical protein